MFFGKRKNSPNLSQFENESTFWKRKLIPELILKMKTYLVFRVKSLQQWQFGWNELASFDYLSGVHVLLVSLFGRPIVRSILNFVVHPLMNKKIPKLTRQLVDQRDWPKVNGRRFNPSYDLGLVLSYWFWSITFVSTHKERVDACVQYKECQSNYPRKISLAQRFVPSTLISLINVTSRLPILENNTLHKTKIPPARLLISLQNFQYSYRT